MSSISGLLNIPVIIKPLLRIDGAGDAVYGQLINTTCYADETIKNIVDVSGKETVSSISFYIAGSTDISKDDLVVFGGKEYRIKARSAARDIKGKCLLWTVYA